MGKKIMVVDDNPSIILLIKKGLEDIQADYDILTAENGKQCLELLQKNIPDLILLDIMMPEMNGWEVFKKLRQNQSWRKIPVAFLTAKTDNFSRGFGKILAQAYIEKPFEIEELKQRIDALLEKPVDIPPTKEKIVDDMIKNAIP